MQARALEWLTVLFGREIRVEQLRGIGIRCPLRSSVIEIELWPMTVEGALANGTVSGL